MVRHGKKPTVAFGRTVEKPDIYCDEHGLSLRGKLSGCKRWTQRIVIRGTRRGFGPGTVRLVALAYALAGYRSNSISTRLNGTSTPRR